MNPQWPAIAVALLLLGLVIWGIVVQVKEMHAQSDPVLRDLVERTRPLFEREEPFTGLLEPLNHRNILDEISVYKGEKSYTINKEKVYICLKDEHGTYYESGSQLMHVFLHELTHVLLESEIGHTLTFHKALDELLHEAVKMGIYDQNVPLDPDYCKHGSG
jgi:hypothetical protein